MSQNTVTQNNRPLRRTRQGLVRYSALIVFILVGLSVQGQNKDTMQAGFITAGTIHYATSYGGGKRDAILIWDDGRVEIMGDTIRAIKNTFEYIKSYQKSQEKEMASLVEFMNASIAFINQNPTYVTERNCNWPRMLRAIRKQGFGWVKLKHPTTVCASK